VVRVHERDHGFLILLLVRNVYLHEEGQRNVVEHILLQLQSILGQVLEELGFLCDGCVTLEVVHQLLLAGMMVGLDHRAQLIEPQGVRHWLPAEVHLVIRTHRLHPLVVSSQHGILDEFGVVPLNDHEFQVFWVKGCML